MKDDFIKGLHFHGDYASFVCQQKFAEAFNKQMGKLCLPTNLDNTDHPSPSISNLNKQK